jgi:hypothetical protein
MSDVAVAKPAATAPEPATPEANATAAADSHPQTQSQLNIRFNVGPNYKVLGIIGKGVSKCLLGCLCGRWLIDEVQHHI